MRIAVVSDIHDNLTALQAVLADLRETSPDLVFHGGDLVSSGSSPCEVVDLVRDLGWQGVMGNTDEAMVNPEALEEFASRTPAPANLWDAVREMTAFTWDALGSERIAWLARLPRVLHGPSMALVHASPASTWVSPMADAANEDLEAAYGSLGERLVVYGHIHHSYMREMGGLTVINTGSLSQSFDGDPRASYLLIEDGAPEIRRVAYDVEREIAAVQASGLPHADWVARTLRAARPQMP